MAILNRNSQAQVILRREVAVKIFVTKTNFRALLSNLDFAHTDYYARYGAHDDNSSIITNNTT